MSKKYSKELIIQTLQNLAQQLGKDTLSKREISKQISRHAVQRAFGSIGNALEAAGLKRPDIKGHLNATKKTYSDEELFRELKEVEKKLGREPTTLEFVANAKYFEKPYKRFGE